MLHGSVYSEIFSTEGDQTTSLVDGGVATTERSTESLGTEDLSASPGNDGITTAALTATDLGGGVSSDRSSTEGFKTSEDQSASVREYGNTTSELTFTNMMSSDVSSTENLRSHEGQSTSQYDDDIATNAMTTTDSVTSNRSSTEGFKTPKDQPTSVRKDGITTTELTSTNLYGRMTSDNPSTESLRAHDGQSSSQYDNGIASTGMTELYGHVHSDRSLPEDLGNPNDPSKIKGNGKRIRTEVIEEKKCVHNHD